MGNIFDWNRNRDMWIRVLEKQTGQGPDHSNKRVRNENFKDEKSLRAWLNEQGVTGYAESLLVMEQFGGTVAMTGTILLVQNTFDLFSSWAYAWALVAPTSIGLAKLVYASLRGLGDQVQSGLTLTGIGLAIFVFGGLFFEIGIGISGYRFGAAWLCWPGLLIGLGIVLLLSNLIPRRNPPSGNFEEEAQKENEHAT